MKIRAFILTTIPKYFVIFLRVLKDIVKVIPFGAFALVVVGRFAHLAFNEILFIINSVWAYCIGGNKELKRYWKSNPIMNDKKLNVVGQYTLNAVMISGEVEQHLKFGCEFSTVSDQMGRLPKMTPFGTWCKDVFLDTIEGNHCALAVELNNKALLKRVNELNLLNNKTTSTMDTITELETMLLAKIADLKAQYGNSQLNASQKATVSVEIDSVNETWNGDLPPRPTN